MELAPYLLRFGMVRMTVQSYLNATVLPSFVLLHRNTMHANSGLRVLFHV